MSYSIFIANPTALIAQPGRAVNTFPSGLVRVDQTYLGLTSQAAAHRATLAVGNDMPDGDTAPCIDGLKIFPEVQERRREDGFTEFIVSAYGRANAAGTAVEVFFNKLFSFGSLFYGGRQIQRTYLTNSGPSEILTPPIFTPFFLFQFNSEVLDIVYLNENDKVKQSRSSPSDFIVYLNEWMVGSDGGAIVKTLFKNTQTGVDDHQQHFLLFNKGTKYNSHDQRYFGTFSEFVTTYSPGDEVASEVLSFYRFKVNEIEVQ